MDSWLDFTVIQNNLTYFFIGSYPHGVSWRSRTNSILGCDLMRALVYRRPHTGAFEHLPQPRDQVCHPGGDQCCARHTAPDGYFLDVFPGAVASGASCPGEPNGDHGPDTFYVSVHGSDCSGRYRGDTQGTNGSSIIDRPASLAGNDLCCASAGPSQHGAVIRKSVRLAHQGYVAGVHCRRVRADPCGNPGK